MQAEMKNPRAQQAGLSRRDVASGSHWGKWHRGNRDTMNIDHLQKNANKNPSEHSREGFAFCPDYSANLTGRASGLYRGIRTSFLSPRNRISHYSYWLGRVWAGSSWRNRAVPVPTTTPPPWTFPDAFAQRMSNLP